MRLRPFTATEYGRFVGQLKAGLAVVSRCMDCFGAYGYSVTDNDQVFYRRADEVDTVGDEPTDTELYEGLTGSDTAELEGLAATELRDDETDDPNIASQEGLAYIPPSDPPVTSDPDDPQGARIAAGFGSTAEDEPYDQSHRAELLSAEDDFTARIREALVADATTSGFADSLIIGTRGSTVVVRGEVDDIDDTDNIVEVISRVAGVEDVIDETEVRGVTD